MFVILYSVGTIDCSSAVNVVLILYYKKKVLTQVCISNVNGLSNNFRGNYFAS